MVIRHGIKHGKKGLGPKGRAIKNGKVVSFKIDGINRHAYLYTPSSYDPSQPMPLMLAFHGGQSNSVNFVVITGFNEVAEREGFMVAYPNAHEGHWRDGRNSPRFDQTTNDVLYVSLLIEKIKRIRNVDRRRIYTAGLSNGGFLVFRLACELSDKIAAYATVAATIPEAYDPKPKEPVSLLMIHGLKDKFIPWSGGRMLDATRITSVPKTFKFWKEHNQCESVKADVFADEANLKQEPKLQIRCLKGQACKHNTSLELIVIPGAGHTWPGGFKQPPVILGPTNTILKGSQVIWDFCSRHARD